MKPFQHVAARLRRFAGRDERRTLDVRRGTRSPLQRHDRPRDWLDRASTKAFLNGTASRQRCSPSPRMCAFEESELHWLVEDGDACSVLLRMTSPPINADMCWWWVHGAKENDEGLLLG